ncbi:MAG TPA: hypothetical protein VIM33_14130 [Gaiellaceae bacterium]
MAYVTLSEARSAAATRWVTKSLAESALRTAAAASTSTDYDIFLSHSREDAQVIAGVKTLLEQEGASVYVYWAEENQVAPVTASTAAKLRVRMNHCRSLIYASSEASPQSKWMPWELGYFDGRKPGHVAIMPLPSSSTFTGQEYLGLYPNVERVSFQSGRRGLAVRNPATTKALSSFMREGLSL